MAIVLGAIADDFTGATDLANTLVKEGMRVVQVIGVPKDDENIGDAQAVVVALKSRMAPVTEAVNESLEALAWLRAKGAQQIISKYCSTFDSTDQGNIGAIADALMGALGNEFAFVCPAFPANGRTIYQGHLFVGADLLSDSSMKDHPLTPMRDSNLIRLMERQSAHGVGSIPLEVVRAGADAIADKVNALKASGKRYGVVDGLTDDDLREIGRAAKDHVLITGGSGVALGLPDNHRSAGVLETKMAPVTPEIAGRKLVLAGSCSAATRAQIAEMADKWPTRQIDVDEVFAGKDVAKELIDWAISQPDEHPVLIYSSADPKEVAKAQEKYGVARAGERIEQVIAKVAQRLSACGFRQLVIAGGETSGAVVAALGVHALRIGPEIAPGVPWTESLSKEPLALALKSGNFGGVAFFEEAFEALS